MDEKKISGIPVDGQDVHYFKKDDLLFIQDGKEGNRRGNPTFYTKKGRFTICTTLELAEENMPAFEHFHTWNVVNKLTIDRIDDTAFGYVVFFKDTNITTEISSASTKMLICIATSMKIDSFIVTKDNVVQFLPLRGVCYIDLTELNRWARTPRLHTKNEVFLMSTALRQIGEVLELALVDSGVYTNIDNIGHIKTSPYGAMIHFVGSDYKTTISRKKGKLSRFIIPIIKSD